MSKEETPMADELNELEYAELCRLAVSEGVSIEGVPGGGAYRTDALRYRIRARRANEARTAHYARQVRRPAWIGAVAAILAAVLGALNYFCSRGSAG